MLKLSTQSVISMTKTKTILAVSFAAVFAIGVISLPAFAADFGQPHLTKTKLTIDGDKYSKIEFKTDGKIPKTGAFGGYAILTDGDVIAVTSHQGAFDSETQTWPAPGVTFGLCGAPALAAGHCGPVWHSHLVTPTSDARCATGLAIGGLTHEEPTSKVKVKGSKITLEKIPLGTSGFTESVSGIVGTLFTAGLPVDSDGLTGATTPGVFDGVEFPLTPVGAGPTFGICIGPAI